MNRNILLIGLMGVGKTSVARGVARELGMDFFDTDLEMEEVTGLKLKEIYRKYGEIRFRSEEALIMNKLRQKENCVISVGASLPMTEATRELLPRLGYVIWLSGSLAVIKDRLRRKYNRVLLPKGVTMKNFDSWALARCEEFRALAQFTVHVENKDLDGVIRCIVEKLSAPSGSAL